MDTNGTYKKLRAKVAKAQQIISDYYAYMERYMFSGIDGHEWEYIELAKNTIAELKREIEG